MEVIKSALTPKGSFTEAWKTVTADATRTIFHISKDKHSQALRLCLVGVQSNGVVTRYLGGSATSDGTMPVSTRASKTK